jgi:hypothetical protein
MTHNISDKSVLSFSHSKYFCQDIVPRLSQDITVHIHCAAIILGREEEGRVESYYTTALILVHCDKTM